MVLRTLAMVIVPVSLATAATAASGSALAAQSDVTIEIGASQVGPPIGLEAESARFLVGGLRASHWGTSGSGVFGSLLAGRTVGDANGGDFLTANFGGTMAQQWVPSLRGALDVELLAFGVQAPYAYRAVTVEVEPSVTFAFGPAALELAGIAGTGSARVETTVRTNTGTVAARYLFEKQLARVGGTAELRLGTGPVRFGVAGGVHGTPEGSYTSGGGSLLFAGNWGALQVRGDVWRTPAGTQGTGGLSLVLPLSGWSVRGFFGRSEPDPLTLAEPGSASGGLLLGRSLVSRPVGGARRQPWQLVSLTAAGATVRLSIEAPAGARSVALLGDFTLWDARPMQLRDGRWEIELEVPTGTHHYGFLVDDEWYVPDDTRDVVPDEWGRRSAILVIEGVD